MFEYCLFEFREAVRLNKKNILTRLVKKYLVKVALFHYRIYSSKLAPTKMKLGSDEEVNSKLGMMSSSTSLVSSCLRIFRELVRTNKGNILMKLFKRKLIQIARKFYKVYNR